MKSGQTAIITRAEDGLFQPMLLAAQSNASVYRLTGCVLRKMGRPGAPNHVSTNHVSTNHVSTLADLPADVFVFVNVPVETTNHMFLAALVGQTMGRVCGLASGILIDQKRTILHSGWEAHPGGAPIDRYAGHAFKPGVIPGVRQVAGISEHFFAVRRHQLLGVGGMSVLSSAHVPHLLCLLTDAARRDNLPILVTPDAVVTRAI